MYSSPAKINLDLKQKLEELKNATKGQFFDQTLNDNSCILIAQYIRDFDCITVLETTNSHITSKGLTILSEAIPNSQNLHKLSLSNNQIGDENSPYFENFCNAISINKSIIYLDLSGNFLGYSSAIYIANLIKTNNTLKTINLKGNKLQNEGCHLLCDALSYNKSLVVLDLNNNQADVNIIRRVEQLLNRSPVKLNNSYNQVNINHQAPNIKEVNLHYPENQIYKKYNSPLQYDDYKYKYEQLVEDYNRLEQRNSKYFEDNKRNRPLMENHFNISPRSDNNSNNQVRQQHEIQELKSALEMKEIKLNQLLAEQKLHYENELTNSSNSIQQKNADINKLKELNANLEININNLQTTITTLSKERLVMEKEFESRYMKDQYEYASSNQKLSQELSILKEKIERQEKEIGSLKNQNNDLHFKIDKFQDLEGILIKEKEAKIHYESQAQIKEHELEEKIHHLNNQIYMKENEINKWKSLYELDYSNLKNMHETQNSDYTTKIKYLEEIYHKHLDDTQHEKNYFKSEIDKLTLQCKENNRLKNENATFLKEIETLKNHLEITKSNNLNLKSNLDFYEKNKKYEQFEQDNKEFKFSGNNNISNIKEENERLRMALSDIEFNLDEIRNRATFYENEFIKLKAHTDHLLQNPAITNIPQEEINPILNIIQEPIVMDGANDHMLLPPNVNPNIPPTPNFGMGPPPKLTRILRRISPNSASRVIQISPMKPIPISPAPHNFIEQIPNPEIFNQPSVVGPNAPVILSRHISPTNPHYEASPIYSRPGIQNIERVGKYREEPPQNFVNRNPYEVRPKSFVSRPKNPEIDNYDYQNKNNPNNNSFGAKY